MSDDGRHHETIWLQPWCDGCETHCRCGDEGRQWCMDDVWEKCDECGNKSVRYVIAKRKRTSKTAQEEVASERDSARALLSEAEVWLAKGVFKHHTDDLLARIAAELEPKP